jgi:hypothetical protein
MAWHGRYRLECNRDGVVVEVFQYNQSSADAGGNPEGPRLKDLNFDSFLATHARLRKRAAELSAHYRRHGEPRPYPQTAVPAHADPLCDLGGRQGF